MSATLPIPETPEPATTASTLHASPGQIFWRRLRRQKLAMLGAVILVILYTIALFAGFLRHTDLNDRIATPSSIHP